MTNPLSLFRSRAGRALVFLGTIVLASAGRESMGDDLGKSNVMPPDLYATVELSQKTLNVVEFKVTPILSSYYASTSSLGFGIYNFTFDSSLAITPSAFTWVQPNRGTAVQNPHAVPFGQFKWMVTTSPLNLNPLIFDVTFPNATPASFTIANPNKATFSAQIAGFTTSPPGPGSQWVSESVARTAQVKFELPWPAIVAAGVVAIMVMAMMVDYLNRRNAPSRPRANP